ncbi:MogA/MoaB family molybdenum cofactor biosynthesis protein [Corynebacterium bovis]|uniref:MogA/MoaB family molybdenum cofactor biosynthesis protein n=2 Tax=Corynebacterium bovis TaxID=36808 RepID=UPI001FD0CC94|nr:molybdopterin-binding protein [Corynebacterium bovis]MDH2455448.1 molybdopterin-binding protein [Corynebacterium bovis]
MLPTLDDVDQASIARLDEQVTEPGDEVFRSLDARVEPEAETGTSIMHALVVIVTDGEGNAGTGELVAELLAEENFLVDAVLEVEPRKTAVRTALETAVVGGADLVITVGGTGAGPRDRTPEATKTVLDKRLPGLSQALRASALACNALDGGLSRGVAGVSGSTVVVNLASSRAAIRDGMATLCPLARWVINDMTRG